jgi:hypothetical protein
LTAHDDLSVLFFWENITRATGLHDANAPVSQGRPTYVAAQTRWLAAFRRRLLQANPARVMFWTNVPAGPIHAETILHGRLTR